MHICELKKGFGGVNYHVHQIMFHQPTKVTTTTSIVEPSLIERLLLPTNVINDLKPIHQPQRNHGQTDRGQRDNSWQGHWQCYGWEHSQDSWDSSEYHISLTQKYQSQETDGQACVSKILKELTQRRQEHQVYTPGASSSGRPVATEDLSSGKKVHLRPNIDGVICQEVRWSRKKKSSCRARKSTHLTIKY